MNDYNLPTIDLLEDDVWDTKNVCKNEIEPETASFVKLLNDNGVRDSHIRVLAGPAVTFYEVTPDKGVSITGVKRLEQKFAELGIRVIAPNPGKETIGFEVRKEQSRLVNIRTLLSSPKFQESDMEIPIAIGRTISNEVLMIDLCKMRHLLVAGATGTGKSVCLHTIITSLLFKKQPTQLKFVLIDPKQCEFGVYKKLENHYLAKLPGDNEPIVTDADKALEVLSSLCIEMENRFNRLMSSKVRNIKEYNIKCSDNGNREMPYIVVVIDEYSDLAAAKGKAIEDNIIRLAQRAHIVGIHIILATQRISYGFITGKLKANFPARIALRVITSADSRTILDRDGAQLLKGNGDMLFSVNGKTYRVQGAFIASSETERLCDYIQQQPVLSVPYLLPES